MSALSIPLAALVVAPRPSTRIPSLPHSRLEALADALEAQGNTLSTEWLWPSTREALEARLGGDPQVDIVYLDAAWADDAQTFAFEGATPEGEPIDVEALGALLGAGGVSLLVVAEADEGAWGGTTLQAVADTLTKAGIPRVVALNPDALTGAFAPSLAALLNALLAGEPLGPAVEAARGEAQNGAARAAGGSLLAHSGSDQPLVATPSPEPADAKVVRFPGLAPGWQRLASQPDPGGLPEESSTGFVGRTSELDSLERMLRDDDTQPLLVFGVEGSGKTTLVSHAARWLVRTGRFEEIVYTSFAGGGHLDWAMRHLGLRLIGDSFLRMEGDRAKAIEEALQAKPTLVIWDGLEALLPGADAPLDPKALNDLLHFGVRVAGAGESRLCAISDSPTLPHGAYTERKDASLRLGGLGPEDGSELIRRALPQTAANWTTPDDRERFVRLLGGHPLALRIVASLSDEYSPAELEQLLDEILPGYGAGEARTGGQPLYVALEALSRTLPAATSEGLVSLGAFVVGFMERLFDRNAGIEQGLWESCKQRLRAASLTQEDVIPGLSVPYMGFHAALGRYLARRIPADQRASFTVRYCGSYIGLLNWMGRNLARNQGPVRALALRELPNFRRTFRLLGLGFDLAVLEDYGRRLQRLLGDLGLPAEREAVANDLAMAIEKAVPQEGPLARLGVRYLLERAQRMLDDGQVAPAGAMLQKLCERVEKEDGLSYSGDDALLDKGIAFSHLAEALRASGREGPNMPASMRALGYLEQVKHKREALPVLVELLRSMGDIQLGVSQPARARAIYERALGYAEGMADGRSRGLIHSRLGFIALTEKAYDRARELLNSALEDLTACDDASGLAEVWGSLGTLAQGEGDLEKAESALLRASEFAQKAGKPSLEAGVLMHLAQMAEQQSDLKAAEESYARAIAIYQEQGMRPAVVSGATALAELLLSDGQLAKARTHAEAARAAMEGSGAHTQPWGVYNLLHRIAQAEDDQARATHWMERALESFASSGQARVVMKQWAPVLLGVAKASRGEALDASTVELLERLEAEPAWANVASAIWRVLAGERDESLVEGLDFVDRYLVERLLKGVDDPETLEEKAEPPAGRQAMGVPFSQGMAAVHAAASGNEQANAAAEAFVKALAADKNPRPMKDLATVLQRILAGERDPALVEGLPDEVAKSVSALLQELVQSEQS